MSGSGISWAICKSAPRSRQITIPALHHQFLQAGCPSCRPTNSVKALKANNATFVTSNINIRVSVCVCADVLAVDVLIAGQSLSPVYCLNDACHSQTGGNFTYYIPLHATMPANSTLSLQSVHACILLLARQPCG